jgi:phenylalanyl-tRNA synthetase beta chain
MRAPLSWLRDYAPLSGDVADLANTLSSLGLVVEGIERVGEGLGDIVVARVLEIRPIESADQIRMVVVDAAGGEPLEVVCGAWNFAVGDLVPLAPVGAVLPGGFEIGRRKMRGQWSNGMLCSAGELRLPQPADAADGILILPSGVAEPGTPLVEALGLEKPDVVFDLDISANRPDALCMAGVGRDLAAALGEPWRRPDSPAPVGVDASLGTASLVVEAGDLCPRFTATVLERVPEGPSPAWMARRLTLAGMRPISMVVDVSNYVMLDVGQPNHAYDLDRLAGGGLLIRRGRPGETLVTLDGMDRTLIEEDCVIADAEGTGVGVGGIMGGSATEIGAGTRRVLLEAAWFTPMVIARTGTRLGLHSEARVRFERGVDPEIADVAIDRFVGLLGSGVRRGPTADVRDVAHLPSPPPVRVRTDRVNTILGTALDDDDVVSLLAPIGFSAERDEPGVQTVSIPSWRLDSEREIDIIEEVARMWGYRRVTRTVPSGVKGGPVGLTQRQQDRRRLRDVLAGAGYDEAWTTTFLAPGDIERAGLDAAAVEVENPLDQSESILRTTLLPGLLKAVRANVDRQAGDVCLFEIGNVFDPPGGGSVLPVETEALGIIVCPDGSAPADAAAAAAVRTWHYLADAFRLDDVLVEADPWAGWHPTRSARIVGPSNAVLGAVGEIDPLVTEAYGLDRRVGYVSLTVDGLLGEPRRPLQARDVSRYPASDIDLAFVVGETVAAGVVGRTLGATGGDLVESVALFDVYRGPSVGEGRRSLAFRVRYRAPDRTLSDRELAAVRQEAIDAVVGSHGAELRS